MTTRSDRGHEFNQMLGEVVEVEAAIAQRHIARVMPVGDIDVVLGQQNANRIAQQGREMAGHRRNHQHRRLMDGRIFLEMKQRRERRRKGRLFGDGDFLITDHDGIEAERRPLVGQAGAADDLAGCRQFARPRCILPFDRRLLEKVGRHFGEIEEGPLRVIEGLVGLIQHHEAKALRLRKRESDQPLLLCNMRTSARPL